VNGVYRFASTEVDALAAELESERKALEASQAITVEIHRMFDLHLRAPTTWSTEGIAEKAGVDPRVVRSMFVKWADEFLSEVPRLFSRRELQAIQEREEREAEREHAERMARWAREGEEQLKRHEAEWKRKRAEQDAKDAARANERRQRRAREERERAAALSRIERADPDLHLHLSRIAAAVTLQDVFRLAEELWKGQR
jgi:hypothetical protein